MSDLFNSKYKSGFDRVVDYLFNCWIELLIMK